MSETEQSRVRAIVLTTQRTGSTFLVECLRTHPQIECASEILVGDPENPQAPRYRGKYKVVAKIGRIIKSGAWRPGHRMERYFQEGTATVRAFKVMYNQLAHPFARRYLQCDPSIRIVHLRRANLLKVQISKLLMSARERVQATAPVDAVQIRVEPVRVLEALRRARATHEHFEQLFRDHARLPISYEELFDGAYLREDTGQRICSFLGVQYHPMKSRIVKLNPESLRDMISNYDELADAVSRSEFADMLA